MISLRGAKLHNLQNIDAYFPKNAITVVCGPSGCGKSSLAFDTLHGESKRRYLESLSPFALKILGGKKYIPLRDASGLIPSIALAPSQGDSPAKETALSIASLDDIFHTLWASVAKPVCPVCMQEMVFQTREEIISKIALMPEKSRIQCIAPINPNKKTLKELASSFLQQGFSRVLADNKPYSLADLHENDFEKIPQKFEIIVDRIIIREGIRTRISEALDACLKLTHHKIEIDCENERIIYSTLPICKNGHTPETFLIPEAKDFSPYSHNGSCATCKGTGLSEDESICETCNGLRLKTYLLNTTTKFGNYKDIIGKNFSEFSFIVQKLFTTVPAHLKRTQEALFERLNAIQDLGISYLSPSRSGRSLSGGELQRLRLVAAVTGYLDGMLFCLDEPAAGLHSDDAIKLFSVLESIKKRGNTLVLMEHHPEIISRADWIIEMGEGAGKNGGKVLFQGTLKDFLLQENSPTRNWLLRLNKSKDSPRKIPDQSKNLEVKNFSKFGIQPISAKFPLGHFSVITGPSGSGKSTLLFEHLIPEFQKGTYAPLGLKKINILSTGSFQGNKRSTIASAIQISSPLRELFASLPESKLRGYSAKKFATHTPGGRCETCKGEGILTSPDGFEESECPVCLGKRFRDEVLEIRFKSLSFADILALSVEEAMYLFEAFPNFFPKLKTLADTGLGYLHLGQTTNQLSSGERARLRLSIALQKKTTEPSLYLFDEPARGLHEIDIQKLLELFFALCKQGHTLIAIEHSKDFIQNADYVLELKTNHSSQ